MYDVIVTEQAKHDLLEACTWYENEKPGLGHEFWLDVMHHLDVLAANPFAAPAVTEDSAVRKRVMRRFPYRL